MSDRSLLTTGTIISLLLATTTSAGGQIIPDNTLQGNTIVAPNGQTINIEGGTRSGGNLFHSFAEFNLGAGSTAFFNNAVDIQNILSRVTGGNISNIDGLIKANGAANLFLVNPAGIVFGPNARLNIGGSFLASTADSVIFNEGSFYSATNPDAEPLLLVNVPIGLQMGPNPASILVRGTGHKLRRESDFTPTDRSEQLRAPTGLIVQPGNSITIVGGDVTLDGGVLTAPEGRIELGGIKEGNVSIEPNGTLGYDSARQFGDILMVSRALLDASSIPGGGSAGSIQMQGRNVELRGGSFAFIQNLGLQAAGNISVNARESVNLIGTAPNSAGVRSILFDEVLGSGDGGGVDVVAARLLISDGGAIGASTLSQDILSPGRGGDLNIQVSESVELVGASPIGSVIVSLIGSGAFGTGRAGRVTVTTPQLRAIDGGGVTSSAFGLGRGGGEIVVDADTIEIIGVQRNSLVPSNISVVSFSQGEAGNLIVNAGSLLVKDGGLVGASAGSSGPAGSVTINALESVEVSGIGSGSINPSRIDSSATVFDEAFQEAFRLPQVPTGDTGEVTINAPRLRVTDGGLVGVQHQGTGNAGALRIKAGSVLVESGGSISVGSASGFGGNISLYVGDSLLLRDGGSIAAEAGGGGDGGNLTINAGTIALLRNSNINVNAFEGTGGNIRISAEGLFPSADSAITASSQLGVDGRVEVEGLSNEASKGFAEVSNNLPDFTALIANGCEEYANSEFIVTGRGGLPPSPLQRLNPVNPIVEWAQPEEEEGKRQKARGNREDLAIPQFIEATGWVRRDDGTIELVANQGAVGSSWYRSPDCQSMEEKFGGDRSY